MDAADPFPPIEELAFLADGETAALISGTGTVEWLCLPRIDSPSVFGALLDRRAGAWRLAPTDPAGTVTRRYRPGSLVLETEWRTASGRVQVTDALLAPDAGAAHVLVRLVAGLAGEVELVSDCGAAPDYGRGHPAWRPAADGDAWTTDISDGPTLRLAGHPGPDDPSVPARIRVRAGESVVLTLSWGAAAAVPIDPAAAATAIDATDRAWSAWLASGAIPDGAWRPLLERSALVLRGLTYAPSGLPVAAATTSLPETPGGERNWDYRYTWLRDGTFTLAALQDLGFPAEARRFIAFLAAEHARGVPLQLMVRVGGELDLPESELDHLSGYDGARPVRIGNGAAHQAQHDMWGVLLDLVWRDVAGGGALDDATWALAVPQVEAAIAHWRLPDRGVWEVRGEPRHFTSSKLLGWVALDRGARLARVRGDAALATAWGAEAAVIRADLEAHGTDGRGVFTQSYGAPALDASLLLVPLTGFLPPDDPRVRATVLAIADELTERGLVLRYRVDTADDGLTGEEGSFMICSFWLVQALVRIGERGRARALFDHLVSFVSPLGLLAEEIDLGSGRHLGNTPQAFSHLALIGAALDLLDGQGLTDPVVADPDGPSALLRDRVRAAVAARMPIDVTEARVIAAFLAADDPLPHPFDEHADPVHVTGSGIVTGARGVVLLLHKRMGMWLQPGGHIDTGETPWDAALRESTEETGLACRFADGAPRLVHVDVHPGPRGHTHLDLRYLIDGGDADPAPPATESQQVAWFGWDAAIERAGDPRLAVALASLRPR